MTFSHGDELVPFGPGDPAFVFAHVRHRFETFTGDVTAWAIITGDVRSKD